MEPRLLTPTIVGLASQIYAERSFERLPYLAELLEKEGCEDMTLLAHLKGVGPHAKGCFALDAVFGKS